MLRYNCLLGIPFSIIAFMVAELLRAWNLLRQGGGESMRVWWPDLGGIMESDTEG
jgi:hypothetical protein